MTLFVGSPLALRLFDNCLPSPRTKDPHYYGAQYRLCLNCIAVFVTIASANPTYAREHALGRGPAK